MLPTTFDAVKSILRADPSITPADRTAACTAIRNLGRDPAPKPANAQFPQLIKRRDAARLLARSPRAVDRLAEQGVLRKVTLPGRQRAAGFRLADVQALIGEAA